MSRGTHVNALPKNVSAIYRLRKSLIETPPSLTSSGVSLSVITVTQQSHVSILDTVCARVRVGVCVCVRVSITAKLIAQISRSWGQIPTLPVFMR